MRLHRLWIWLAVATLLLMAEVSAITEQGVSVSLLGAMLAALLVVLFLMPLRSKWAGRLVFLSGYAALFVPVWARGQEGFSLPSGSGSWAILWPAAVAVVSIGLVAWAEEGGATWKRIWPLGGLVALGACVAFFCGGNGAGAPMESYLISLLHISQADAELAVHVIRKTVHVVFYGSLAWTGARAVLAGNGAVAEASAFGLAWALPHAAFDELNQAAAVGRSGTGWDVLLDSGGMLLFLLPLALRSLWESRR